MNKPKLLLHCCCAPCSSAILEHLVPYYDITLYFYNPNITDAGEYDDRLSELVRFIVESGYKKDVKVVWEPFNPEPFYDKCTKLKEYHEGGTRCEVCYALRLRQAAKYAEENHFAIFSTTLTISPYKDSSVINRIGTNVASKYPNLMYMPFDFGYLYTRSLDLCREYSLYEQDYCGCEYSR